VFVKLSHDEFFVRKIELILAYEELVVDVFNGIFDEHLVLMCS
jgi:hypothetical protein